MKKFLMGVLVGLIIFSGVVYAATNIYSLDVTYDNSNSELSATNVQDALDELYKKLVPPTPITTFISDLYMNATKTTASNNSVTYNYASELGLMNDRLGGTTDDYDAGNIRYYGADPNNYIYFNCSDYSNQTADTCETWRIIGLFKDVEMADGTTQDLIKIARASTIGSYSWDNKPSGTGTSTSLYGSNDWTDARLMMLLNDGYETASDIYAYEGSLYWNAKSGTCYAGSSGATTSCDFTSTGLKNDTTRNMIAEVVWNLGGWNSASIYSNASYGYERGTTVYSGRPTEWTGKVALMYPSDYGYATDFTKCTQNLYNYDNSTCYTNDWLFQTSTVQWLLTPYSGRSDYAWNVNSSGYVSSSGNVDNTYGVRPVLYLNSELGIGSEGDGTSSNPYRISVS